MRRLSRLAPRSTSTERLAPRRTRAYNFASSQYDAAFGDLPPVDTTSRAIRARSDVGDHTCAASHFSLGGMTQRGLLGAAPPFGTGQTESTRPPSA